MDIFELIRYATNVGLQVALTPSATPLATLPAIQTARNSGVRRLGISLDGSDAKTHDGFRGWQGSFDRTLQMMADARQVGLAVQVNTTITRRNFHQIDNREMSHGPAHVLPPLSKFILSFHICRDAFFWRSALATTPDSRFERNRLMTPKAEYCSLAISHLIHPTGRK